jgi:ketosteroid isomerase-like protein
MPKVSPIQESFSGGEVSPLLFGRTSLDRLKQSLAVSENYLPTLQGGLVRRSGTKFVAETKYPTKESVLIEFEFSTTQAYMLEFGDQYIRFFKDNAIITEAAKNITGITQANPAVVTSNSHGFSNGDRLILSGISGMTELNNREVIVAGVTANTFQLKDTTNTNINSTGYTAYSSGGTASKIYEISSPYEEADLSQIKYTQSADILYLVHPDYKPRKLSRTGHTSWTLTEMDFLDGPYLSTNVGPFTLIPSAFTGAITLTTGPTASVSGCANNGSGLIRVTTASHVFSTGDRVHLDGITGTTEANGDWTVTVIDTNHFDLQGSAFVHAYVAGGTARPGLFVSTDVGRSLRVRDGTVWGWGTITAYTDEANVSVSVVDTFTSTNSKSGWRLGLWSETTGYPSCVVFHEDRLFFSGSRFSPQRIDGSNTGDYENFEPSDPDGTIVASHAVSFNLNSNDVNVGRWLNSDEKGLAAGSVGREWIVRPSSQSEALSPTNITAKSPTSEGSADIQAIQAGRASIYVQRAGRQLREFTYFYDVDGFKSTDLTQLAVHITESGIRQIAYLKVPHPVVFCVREDGVVASMTYDRDSESLKVGWSRHILAGPSDASDSNSIVRSVAVIPSADGSREEPWFIVKRYINGRVVRYVEYMDKLFDDEDEQSEAYFVDCGLTYDEPKTITGATAANPVVITSAAHGFSNGDRVLISGMVGLKDVSELDEDETEADATNALEGRIFTVANKSANTFELSGEDGSAYTAYTAGGEVRKLVTSISGLFHLEGETIQVLGDGAVQPDVTVSGGSVTLTQSAATVHLGYSFRSRGQMLRIEAGAADGTALGKTRRTHRVGMLLHRTLGLKLGMSFEDMNEVVFRTTSDPLTRATPLYSGIISETMDADYDFENQIAWEQDQPLPGMILAVMPQMVTQDR